MAENSGIGWTHHTKNFFWGCNKVTAAAKEKRVKMDLDWVRNVDEQCNNWAIPHYFKQYYKTDEAGNEIGVPCPDGMLDGIKVQNFPVSPAPIPESGELKK